MRRTLVVTVLVATLTSLVASPGGASSSGPATSWRFRSSTLLPGSQDVPNDVACPKATECVAVGVDGLDQAVATEGVESGGRWAWGRWSSVGEGGVASSLAAVACPSSTTCLAVGVSGTVALGLVGERTGAVWHWTAATLGGTDAASQLESVACDTTTSCVAAGIDPLGQAVTTTITAPVGTWQWSPLQSVASDASGGYALVRIACARPGACVLVGTDEAAQGVVLQGAKTNSAWRFGLPELVGSDPSGATHLRGVACPAPRSCVLVGDDAEGDGVVVVAQDAGSWSWSDAAPLGPTVPSITGISCRADACVAVASGASSTMVTLAASGSFSSSSWTVSPLPTSGSVTGPQLATVACPLIEDCVAMGTDGSGDGIVATSISTPSAATGVAATAGNGTATVRWHAPAFDGGTPLGGYVVVASPGGARCGAAPGTTTRQCRVVGLRNGVRYRFEVLDRNALGTTASPPSAPVTPSRFQPPVPTPLDASVRAYVAGRPGEISVCVADLLTGQRWVLHPGSEQHTASVVKVEILATLLYDHQRSGRPLSAQDQALATAMIEESDNDAAQDLYVEIGQQPGLAAFSRRIGLTGTTPSWAWGFTDTTALDQSRVVALFAEPNRVLDAASRAYGLGLLRHVDPAQAWGISAGPPHGASVAIKNGWYPTGPGNWQVNSEGWVTGFGRSYVIAVLTRDNLEMSTGVTTIEGISSMVWARLAPRREAGRLRGRA